MKDHHPEIPEDRLFFFEREEVVVEDYQIEQPRVVGRSQKRAILSAVQAAAGCE